MKIFLNFQYKYEQCDSDIQWLKISFIFTIAEGYSFAGGGGVLLCFFVFNNFNKSDLHL